MNTASRYRLLARWASGGMADVYVARQQALAGFDKIVALKFLRDAGDHTGFREMFLDEVRTAALLNHPNIVQTFDAGEIGDHLFLAMEFVNGETLGRFARVVSRASGVFPVELAVAIARDLANALEYAHTLTNLDGVPLALVHRDVSPSNILLSFEGSVKLFDFGIAKVATKLKATDAGIIKGKFSYMAPEQARGQLVDHRADIYSLGLLLWQLLTGRPAFEAKSDAELLHLVMNPELSPPSATGAICRQELDQIVMTALAPRIEDRYASAGELATELTRYLTRYAAGFDSAKLIRALMAANFSERRDRLAALVKRSDTDVALEELDAFAYQPSVRTPSPMSIKPPEPVSSNVDASVPIGTISSAQPPNLRPSRLPWLIAGVIAAVGAGYVLHDQIGEPEETNPPVVAAEDAPPQPKPPVVAALDAPATPDVADTTKAERSDRDRGDRTVAVAPHVVEPPKPPTRSAPPPPRIVAIRPAKREAPATGSGTGSAKTDKGSAARIEKGSATEPVVKALPPPTVSPRVTPPPTLPPAPPKKPIGSLDAMPAFARVSVRGSLPTSEIHSALERTTGMLRECYRAAANRAQQTPAIAIRIAFVIDEARAPRAIRVTGDPIGLGACVHDAIVNIRTRSAPDVGTVSVIAQISFRPIKK